MLLDLERKCAGARKQGREHVGPPRDESASTQVRYSIAGANLNTARTHAGTMPHSAMRQDAALRPCGRTGGVHNTGGRVRVGFGMGNWSETDRIGIAEFQDGGVRARD